MRALIIVLGLAATGILTGCHATQHPPAGSTTTATRTPVRPAPPAPLSARVQLPSHTMAAGSSMAGHLVIQNNTRQAIKKGGCGSLFQVALVSSGYQPTIVWATCFQEITIPTGRTSYPVTVLGVYDHCSSHAGNGTVACLPHNRPPPLPAGTYRVVLFQSTHVVPAPPAIIVRLTPAR